MFKWVSLPSGTFRIIWIIYWFNPLNFFFLSNEFLKLVLKLSRDLSRGTSTCQCDETVKFHYGQRLKSQIEKLFKRPERLLRPWTTIPRVSIHLPLEPIYFRIKNRPIYDSGNNIFYDF
jgi:hypothetical protein